MLNDTQFSALAEIARTGLFSTANEAHRKEIEALVAASLIVRTGPGEFDLTPTGRKALDDRGADANGA
jgi:hypothetical protein